MTKMSESTLRIVDDLMKVRTDITYEMLTDEAYASDPNSTDLIIAHIIGRVVELRKYPILAAKEELNKLLVGINYGYLASDAALPMKYMLYCELLEIGCLSTRERAEYMARLVDTFDKLGKADEALEWTRDTMAYAVANGDRVVAVLMAERLGYDDVDDD